MSKRTRHSDNSKRQQPIQQQRAQARLPGNARQADRQADRQEGEQQQRGGSSREPAQKRQ